MRPLELKDAETAQRHFPHWEIVKYMNARIPWPYPDNGAIQHYANVSMPAILAGKALSWTIRLKESDEMIGAIDLFLEDEDGDDRGFWLGIPWQKQGLMTEASDVVTDYWFNVLGKSRLRMSKAVANVASRRVSERCGMHIVGRTMRDYVSGHLEAEIWEITKEEWQRYRSGS